VTVLLVSAVGVALFFPHAGQFLVVEDEFAHATVALVLSGDPVRRSLAARDLYRQDRIDGILVIPEHEDPLEEELVRLGLLAPNLPPWSERVLVASGVPRSKITVLPEPADGTITEALQVRAFLRGRFPPMLVLITSTSASRRARFVFRQILKHEPVTVLCSPNLRDGFQPQRWWRHPRNALTVVTEYQKLLANALTLALTRPEDSLGP